MKPNVNCSIHMGPIFSRNAASFGFGLAILTSIWVPAGRSSKAYVSVTFGAPGTGPSADIVT